MIFSVLADAAEAYNAISWADAIPFLAVIIGLYYVKVRIDSSAGLGKKRRRELKQVIVEAITESGLTHKNS
jgi:hypothetical protein|tara:strand:+ start:199 stop:411 length:213 start_codon:yes stop_codon:yes gene_type:complete